MTGLQNCSTDWWVPGQVWGEDCRQTRVASKGNKRMLRWTGKSNTTTADVTYCPLAKGNHWGENSLFFSKVLLNKKSSHRTLL
jgi:hypothetical protein